MLRRHLPAAGALLALLVVAQLLVAAFWPRTGVLPPLSVRPEDYFTPLELERASSYRAPGLAMYVGQTLIAFALLAWLVARPPSWLERLTGPATAMVTGSADGEQTRAVSRVWWPVARTAAALSALLTLAALPIAMVARQRSLDVGLATAPWHEWAWDVALSAVIDAVMIAVLAVALVGLMRRWPRRWWLPASALVACGGAAMVLVTPTVIDPLFNRFTPIEGPAERELVELAERAGVQVGEVLVMDASRRTSAANAYVAGLGTTKRVVIYDTLLSEFAPSEQRAVFAHELAHQHYRDVATGLLIGLLIAPLGLFTVAKLTAAWSSTPQRPAGPGLLANARTLPALGLAILLTSTLLTTVFNQLSRRVEARADTYALQLTGDPQAFIDFKVKLALQNVSEPSRGPWSTALTATHPAPIERIGVGEAWAAGARP